MRGLIFLFLILFGGSSFAGGTCTATQFGYENYCAAQPDKTSCDFQTYCRWASGGYGSCSAREAGYESYCSVQPSRAACEFQSQCFWSCENGPGTCN